MLIAIVISGINYTTQGGLMKRTVASLCLVAMALLPAQALTQTLFTIKLDGSQIVPAVVTSGQGTGWAVLSADMKSLTYRMTVAKLNTPATGGHFHAGGTGGGNVVEEINLAGNTTAGTWANLPDSIVAHLLAGELFINVHTGTYPGGEIQGYLQLAHGTGFTISMDASQEPGSILSGAQGTGFAVLDSLQTNLTFDITIAGLSAALTASHFHVLPSPVVHAISFVDSTSQGVWTGVSSTNVASLLQGNLYANVHSSNYPGGEIRGMLVEVGSQAVSSVDLTQPSTPTAFALEQNYPNPFNPATTIRYTIAGVAALSGSEGPATNVRLAVYDLLGREVAVLVDQQMEPGSYVTRFGGSRLSSGVYIYRLAVGGAVVDARKMILSK
jgi:hypothetical protein